MFRLLRGGGRSSEAGWSPSCGQVPTTRAFLAGRPSERASAGTRDPPKRLMREKKWENGGGGIFPLSRDVFGHFSRYDCPFMAGRRRRGSRKVDWSSHLIRLRAAAEGYKSVEKMLFVEKYRKQLFLYEKIFAELGFLPFPLPRPTK